MCKMASTNNTCNSTSNTSNASNSTSNKYWGIWLPIPTVIVVINSLFWTWLILQTVGNTEPSIEESAEEVIQRF